MKIIFKITIAIILIAAGFSWLSYVGLVEKGPSLSFFYCAMSAIPAAFMLMGFMLIYSCCAGSRFIYITSNKYPSRSKILCFFIDFISGTLLALGFFFIIIFLSPPLPFFDPHCATGHNSVGMLLLACIPLGLRHILIRDIKTEINKNVSLDLQSPPITDK